MKAVATCALVTGLTLVAPAASGWAQDAPAPAATTTEAQAKPKPKPKPKPARVFGVVVSPYGLNVRARPTVNSDVVANLENRERIGLECQVRGGWVDGNPIWYKVHGVKGWVAARYVHNLQPVRPC
ncbi:SH3 domain-containing protein (plasmid) [Streptomyces sp. BI20]|uniref:SH3 domain-containing protein n=1 Tax=Streptomyces sp. BI20 TaxID=3403460 RepID=UPI003C728674